MATEKQLQTLNKYVDAIHEFLIDQINGILTSPDRRIIASKSIFARMLGQMLYEAPKLHTGMVSIRLIEQKLRNFSIKPCMEHHHSRQRGGMVLIDLIDRAVTTGQMPSKQQVRDIALQYCQVHYTTADENSMLRKHQRRCSSEASYRRSNIQLIQAPDLFTRRGKHSAIWKQQMHDKYDSIVDTYNNPENQPIDIDIPPMIR